MLQIGLWKKFLFDIENVLKIHTVLVPGGWRVVDYFGLWEVGTLGGGGGEVPLLHPLDETLIMLT